MFEDELTEWRSSIVKERAITYMITSQPSQWRSWAFSRGSRTICLVSYSKACRDPDVLTSLRIHDKEEEPDGDSEDILIARHRKTRDVEMTPERLFANVGIANVWILSVSMERHLRDITHIQCHGFHYSSE
jgi:hypothetical protein